MSRAETGVKMFRQAMGIKMYTKKEIIQRRKERKEKGVKDWEQGDLAGRDLAGDANDETRLFYDDDFMD
jgi:hypothetical protein